MAEVFPDEGLDYILGVIPKAGSTPATLYIGFFTSQTASTVPAGTAVLATGTGVTEATGTAYARQSIASASWGAIAAGGGGRRTTAGQVTFPTVGAGGWGTLNGFFIATTAGAGTGIAVYYANFDDLTAIPSAVNDVIKVTPSWTATG